MPILQRASLHLFPESQMRASTPTRENRACWGPRARRAQLRANLHPTEPKPGSSGAPGLRRKEGFHSSALWHDFAAFASLHSAQAKRSSRALTLVSWTEGREE